MNTRHSHRHPTLRRWVTCALLELDEFVWAVTWLLGFAEQPSPSKDRDRRTRP